MARLPKLGENEWGEVLNDFLRQSHNDDGTLKTASVSGSALTPQAVAAGSIADGAIPPSKIKGLGTMASQDTSSYMTTTQLASAYLSTSELDQLPLNAKQFGAVGDGMVDDTSALQALFDAAVASRRAAYIPQGRYKITASLSIALGDATEWVGGVKVYGDGMGHAKDGSYSSSIIEPTNSVVSAAIVVSGTSNSDNSNKGQVNGFVIEDIGIRGVEDGSNGDGICLSYFTNLTIRRVMVSFCSTGLRVKRQANGTTYGYANNTIIEQFFAVANRGWGLDAADAGAICGMVVTASNFCTNALGGIKIAPSPAMFTGNILTGNGGPAVLVVKPTGNSNATGPTFVGEHFETNGLVAVSPYSAGTAQIVLEYAQSPRFFGCNWLGSTAGQNDIMAGHVDSVTGLTMTGGSHFGRTGVASQAVVVVGPKLVRAQIQDTEATGYAGVAARANSGQMFKSTVTNLSTYAHLGAGSIAHGVVTCPKNGAVAVIDNAMLPLGMRGYFEISSQGGTVYAQGTLRRSIDGLTTTIQHVVASSDCVLGISANTLNVTQSNATLLTLYWSLQIVRTA